MVVNEIGGISIRLLDHLAALVSGKVPSIGGRLVAIGRSWDWNG